jgi:hypothetical protein
MVARSAAFALDLAGEQPAQRGRSHAPHARARKGQMTRKIKPVCDCDDYRRRRCDEPSSAAGRLCSPKLMGADFTRRQRLSPILGTAQSPKRRSTITEQPRASNSAQAPSARAARDRDAGFSDEEEMKPYKTDHAAR